MTKTVALKPLSTGLTRASSGLNLCHENAAELFDQRPELDFIQIHPEHIIQEEGGTYRDQLDVLRRHYNVVLHGFGLSIGSSAPLDKEYLLLDRELLKEHPEAVFSDHFSWSSLSKHHFHDLIPLIQNEETMNYMVARITEAQEIIGSPILLENISSYMRYKNSTMTEMEFINQISRTAGSYVLLVINNIWANSMNFNEDQDHICALGPEMVRGYPWLDALKDSNGVVYVDYHREAVHQDVWELYENASNDLVQPASEWENDVPPLNRTLDEVSQIKALLKPYRDEEIMKSPQIVRLQQQFLASLHSQPRQWLWIRHSSAGFGDASEVLGIYLHRAMAHRGQLMMSSSLCDGSSARAHLKNCLRTSMDSHSGNLSMHRSWRRSLQISLGHLISINGSDCHCASPLTPIPQ